MLDKALVPPGAYSITIYGEKTKEFDASELIDSVGQLVVAGELVDSSMLPSSPDSKFMERHAYWYDPERPFKFGACLSLTPGQLTGGAYVLAPVVLTDVKEDDGRTVIPVYMSPDSSVHIVVTRSHPSGFEGRVLGSWGFNNQEDTAQRLVAERRPDNDGALKDCLEYGQHAWVAQEKAYEAWSEFSAWAYSREHAGDPVVYWARITADGRVYGAGLARMTPENLVRDVNDPVRKVSKVDIQLEREITMKVLLDVCPFIEQITPAVEMYYYHAGDRKPVVCSSGSKGQ